MVNVCWQCGDIGISEFLVYCIKCRSAARHSYCLEEVPENPTAKISWFCENCRSKYPSSASKAKSPPPTSPGIVDHGYEISQIGSKNPCQGSENDCLVNSQDQHAVSDVIIGSSVNLDYRVSYDFKTKTLSCSTGGALDTISSSAGLKLNDDGIEEFANENPNRERLKLSDKNMFDNSQALVEGPGINIQFAVEDQGTNIQFADERLPDTSCEASDKLIIEGTSNCNIGGLQRSSVCLRLKEDKTSIGESDKNTIGSASNCSIGALGVVRSSDCFGLEEGEIKAHAKKRRNRRTRPHRKILIPPPKSERDCFHPAVFCKDNNVSDKQIIRSIKMSDTLGSIGPSVFLELKKGERDNYQKDQPESRCLFLPTVIDRQGTCMKFAAKRLFGFSDEPSDRHAIGWVDTEAEIKLPCQLPSPSFPVVPHVWSGSFNINKAEFGSLKGHLSSKACLEVCNLARKLPLALHMQKLPRSVAWPNKFKVSCPTDGHIALYFFAESDRVETALDALVDDIINNDLMLRFEFDEVELLIFSSLVLPHEHQRLYGKYYPWGVFKPRSPMICSLPAGSHTGYQVGETLKPVKRVEKDDHDDGQFKYSNSIRGSRIKGFF